MRRCNSLWMFFMIVLSVLILWIFQRLQKRVY